MSNLNSRSKLTEFPPLEPEEKPDGLKFSFSKFIWNSFGLGRKAEVKFLEFWNYHF